jgi:hypothetical protein
VDRVTRVAGTYAGKVPAAVRLIFALLLILGFPRLVSAQLAMLETTGLRLVYFDPSETFLVPHAARTFLNSLEFQRKVLHFEPHDPVTVLLTDFSDTGNAGATVVPRNTLTVEIAPLNFAFETIAGNERMNIIMNHELVHLATMDPPSSGDRAWRRLFGGKVMPVEEQPESILYFLLTTPRVAAPRWFHEGIAVFLDTWMAGGLGRAQGGYDEMVFRSMVRDGTPIYDPLGLVSEGTKVDFQLQINSYLYGARFMTWLARRYSPEQLIEWVSRQPGSRAYYATQFKHVFGISLEEAWAAWHKDEEAFQQKNLEAIRNHPLTPYTDITKRALGSVSRAHYDPKSGRLYAAFNYPGVVAHIGSIGIDDGRVERLQEIKGPVIYTVSSVAFDPQEQVLFYTTDNGALRDIVRLNPATGETRVLIKDARIGDLAFNRADRTLWGVRHLNGICTLVRLSPPYKQWDQITTWPYGTVMYDIDVSPDGTRLVGSFGEIDGKQEVRIFDTEKLRSGDTTPVAHFDFGTAVPNSFVFSPDGRYVYGSAYLTGVSNLFRYDLQASKLDAITNTETGFFRPVPMPDGSLIAFRYSGEGFVPARVDARPIEDLAAITFLGERLAEEHPIIKSWNAGSPARIPFDSMPQSTRKYKLAGGLRRESFYPVLQGYKDTAAIGMRLNLSDLLQLNRANFTLAYSPDTDLPSEERVHFVGEYHRYDWRGRFAYNGADFYDLFGPTKFGRKGYAASVGYKTTLIYDQPRRLELDLEGEFAANIDRLPEYQNVPVDVDRLLTLQASLTYTDVRNSLGYVDDETGRRWSLVAQAQRVEGTPAPRFHGTYDRGFALPMPHSSIWLRGAAGFSPADRDDPFANFFFGAFGNNYVDHADEKRYRYVYSFPGVDLNEIPGRNFLKGIVEWNLPPWRFRRVGTPGFYLTWARPAVFVSVLATNLDDSDFRRVPYDAGAQLDFRFSLMSVLDLTVSAGGAIAFEDGRRPQREAMFSLKILR